MDLAGLHHSSDPLVLPRARARLLGDDLAMLVLRERRLRETTLALAQLPGPDARAGSALADRLLGLLALLRGLLLGSLLLLAALLRDFLLGNLLLALACLLRRHNYTYTPPFEPRACAQSIRVQHGQPANSVRKSRRRLRVCFIALSLTLGNISLLFVFYTGNF